MERALLWAARLLLYYASPKLTKSALPHNLCARALNGCKRILDMLNCDPYQNPQGSEGGRGRDPVSDEWQDANFANLWTEWICCDSDFFFHDHQMDVKAKAHQPGSLLDHTFPAPSNL
jgi:hypothetical protein